MADRAPYPPLNTLKLVSKDIWIVDGPVIRFGMPWPKMRFPTRMTVIRVNDGDLFVHSPTLLTESLEAEIAGLGKVRYIIGPNRIHYWWIPMWRRAFADAGIWLAPGIREQAGDRIDFEANELGAERGYPWDDDLKSLPVEGSFMTEMVFFHSVSRTLILTDLIENFEPRKLGWPWRWLARAAGVVDPDGKTPRDLRLTFPRGQLKAAVEKMLEWNPERVIMAHGRWYERDGVAELKRAFRWLGPL
ncbi:MULTISPECIES: DUF4336 domain-containing protein [unclassified Mesorhizobium]|uniref:DUF4336 domain-containing protein n=1 Tax=unclassified Mesorhizobium TaxID=325217 RepID=UPI00112D0FC9|nr:MULTISPECIES: DUF4336 domain-containing protein [unclassified Mesorhizobium]TPJ47360.1 DUF4336 domain-containing protein [Mesorhizobium sp. B2-6-6]MBZ9959170.1 DUF4336 domain-containing protein [Mesorhizobium sp. BR1-1-14]MBZ9999769.1 DUF4336 domain-containing protein [Mesorhizobium sp. B264B2A]MCA0005563.1 DUF4336 domain-containing protein [Mesorhizobium sp. B264B1B]MCA0019925.1 DUF4336 domain-containing protein [Mesorhizobium sp. B264B1A]